MFRYHRYKNIYSISHDEKQIKGKLEKMDWYKDKNKSLKVCLAYNEYVYNHLDL